MIITFIITLGALSSIATPHCSLTAFRDDALRDGFEDLLVDLVDR